MTSFYKYRGLEYSNEEKHDFILTNSYTLDPVINSYFWLPTIDGLNDPFEGLFINNIPTEMHSFSHGTSLQEQNNINRQLIELTRKLEVFTKESGVFSLSKNPQDELMWSHYAANHKGICIEYDLDFLVRFVYRKSLHHFSVKYDSAPPSVGINSISEVSAGDIKSRLGCKSKAWEYEDEYRIVCDDLSGKVQTDYRAVKSITFGKKCPEWLVNKVVSLTSGKVPEYYKINLNPLSYELGRTKLAHVSTFKNLAADIEDIDKLEKDIKGHFEYSGNICSKEKCKTIVDHLKSDPHFLEFSSAGDSENDSRSYYVAYTVKHELEGLTLNHCKAYFDKETHKCSCLSITDPEPTKVENLGINEA